MLDMLAAETSFDGGHALALALEPSTDPAAVARRQALTTEALRLDALGPPELVSAVGHPRGRGARRARDHPRSRGAVRGLAHPACRARGAPDAARASAASCRCSPRAPTRSRPALDQLALAIEQAVDAEGVRDGASPRLRALRREHAVARERAGERLRELAASLRSHLQEEFLTERGGRPVLAVRADARGAVPGIVHDASGSGQTLFVEPFALVEQHNRLRELVSEEREEVARILDRALGAARRLRVRRDGRRRRDRAARPRAGVRPARAAQRRLPGAPERRRRAGRGRGIRCSTRRPPWRSTCRSRASARSSSRARTRAARPSR